ncbi:MAG: GNAT family N-acetyltransferase [Rhodoglobus sp.]
MTTSEKPVYEVRDIHEDDFEAWKAHFVNYGVFYETEFTDAIVAGVWEWLMDDSAQLSAVVAVSPAQGAPAPGTIAAFGLYRRLPDTFTASWGWFMDDLYVDPEHRGSGVAGSIIDDIAARAAEDGGGKLRWITNKENDSAKRLYDRVADRTSWILYEKNV